MPMAVEMGRRFFPRCCEVLDRVMEDDMEIDFFLEDCTPEHMRIKKMRFVELKGDVMKAFMADKADHNHSHISLPSSLESDTFLLERARKLLRGDKENKKMQCLGVEEVVKTVAIDKARNTWKSFSSTSSSCSISSPCGAKSDVKKRQLC